MHATLPPTRMWPPPRRRNTYTPGFDYTSERGAAAAPLLFKLPAEAPGGAAGGRCPPSEGATAGTSSSGSAPTSAAPCRLSRHLMLGPAAPQEPAPQPQDGDVAAARSGTSGSSTSSSTSALQLELEGLPRPEPGWGVCVDYCNGGPAFVADEQRADAGAVAAGGAEEGAGTGGGGAAVPHEEAEVLALYAGLQNQVAAVR